MRKIHLYIFAAGILFLWFLLCYRLSTQNLLNIPLLQGGPMPLPQLTQAETIHIEDDWGGFNDISPVLAHYDLAKHNDSFQGQGFFSIGGESGKPVTDTEGITISITAMHNFLSILQQAQLEVGTYPEPSCCDYYPSLTIDLQLPDEKISFFSTSASGDFIIPRSTNAVNPWKGLYGHVPWGVTFRGKTYIVNSPIPAQALATINDYLQKDVLDELFQKLDLR